MSNVYHNIQSDLPRSFNDRDVYHKRIGGVEAPKISKEKTVTTALIALQLTFWPH